MKSTPDWTSTTTVTPTSSLIPKTTVTASWLSDTLSTSTFRTSDERPSSVWSRTENMASVDCIDKTCYLTHRIVEKCIFYIATNNSDCHIPCELSGCTKQIKLNYFCSIWTCEEKTTTTSTTTTTTTITTALTTTTSLPPKPSNSHFDFLTIMSLSANAILVCLLLLILLRLKRQIWQYCKNCRRRRNAQSLNSPNENIPLRSTRFRSNQDRTPAIEIPTLPREPYFGIESRSSSRNESFSFGSNTTRFTTVNLNDEPRNDRFLINPDSIETASNQSNSPAVLNLSDESVRFSITTKKPKKKFFSKRFWRKQSPES